jgi:hypothetical protein
MRGSDDARLAPAAREHWSSDAHRGDLSR